MIQKELVWLGHNSWQLHLGKSVLIIDPFLLLPISPQKASEVKADYVLVSHGHSDHCASALEILQKNDAVLIGMAEVADWFHGKGVKKIEAMNIGGSIPITVSDDSGSTQTVRVMMVPALHSSTMPDGRPGGNSCGFLLSIPNNGKEVGFEEGREIIPLSETLDGCYNLYVACDTGFFPGMSWLGGLGIDLALLPIGDRFTMGPEMSLDAIAALKPKRVIPAHFNSWPPIRQNADAWTDAVRRQGIADPIVLKPGQKITLS